MPPPRSKYPEANDKLLLEAYKKYNTPHWQNTIGVYNAIKADPEYECFSGYTNNGLGKCLKRIHTREAKFLANEADMKSANADPQEGEQDEESGDEAGAGEGKGPVVGQVAQVQQQGIANAQGLINVGDVPTAEPLQPGVVPAAEVKGNKRKKRT
jgi:hypothetical protein